MFVHVLCIWLIDSTVGELKSSQIRQSGEHDIEFSANPVQVVCVKVHGVFCRYIILQYV